MDEDPFTDSNDTKYSHERHIPADYFVAGDDVKTERPRWALLMASGGKIGAEGATIELRDIPSFKQGAFPPFVIRNDGRIRCSVTPIALALLCCDAYSMQFVCWDSRLDEEKLKERQIWNYCEYDHYQIAEKFAKGTGAYKIFHHKAKQRAAAKAPAGPRPLTGSLWFSVKSASELQIADKLTKSSDPYCSCTIPTPDIKKDVSYKTEVIKKTLNPEWYTGDYPAPPQWQKVKGWTKDKLEGPEGPLAIKIVIIDWNKIQAHTVIGRVSIPLTDFEWVRTMGEAKVRDYPVEGGSGTLRVFAAFVIQED